MFCGVVLCGVCFVVREGAVKRGYFACGPFVSLMCFVGNDLGAEGGAAVGRSLTALTALQTLNLWSKALWFVVPCGDVV